MRWVTRGGGPGGRLAGAILLAAIAATGRTAAAEPETPPPAQPAPGQPAPPPLPVPPEPVPYTPATPPAVAEPEEKKPDRWSNSTELSVVVTEGNSSVQTFGLKNTLGYKANKGRARFRIDGMRSDTSDDPYLLVAPGVTFLPGEEPANVSTSAVRPGAEPDVARFFTEGRYEGDLPKKATWNAGASWDTNEDAGIVSRTILFAGLGHVWRDREDLQFRTSYGLSFTDRIEEVEDPEKDQRFAGVRFTSTYKDNWGKLAIYDLDFTYNVSMSDVSDYNADLTQGLSVNLSKHLGLKVSLQLTYAHEPALEEVDVIARVILNDPDGVPGTGDEFFETVASGGIEVTLGEDNLRREKLDSTFRTSLQITY